MKKLSKNFRKIMILTSVLIVIGTALLIQLVLRVNAKPPTAPHISVQEIVDAGSVSPNANIDPINPTPPKTATESYLASNVENPTIANPPGELLSLLQEIKSDLKQQHDAFFYFDDRLQPIRDILPRLESTASAQLSATEHLTQQLQRLETELLEAVAALTESQTANTVNSHTTPPFRLIAIDRWNNQWNAVIEFDGKISMISPQASRAGWLLVDIDPSSHSARFRTSSGEEIRLNISG